jgi:hypothetical protein
MMEKENLIQDALCAEAPLTRLKIVRIRTLVLQDIKEDNIAEADLDLTEEDHTAEIEIIEEKGIAHKEDTATEEEDLILVIEIGTIHVKEEEIIVIALLIEEKVIEEVFPKAIRGRDQSLEVWIEKEEKIKKTEMIGIEEAAAIHLAQVEADQTIDEEIWIKIEGKVDQEAILVTPAVEHQLESNL